ncbi:MAG: peptidase, partial [Planctomycetes bacterium]|nr:peptidase [Planctomycetota bacterium]
MGTLPDQCEALPGDARPGDSAPIEAPVVLNGQITPGDADQFRIRARRGQKLVIRVQARHLTPFLADAVPGWFQPVLTVRDRNGREIAYADDWRFDPDPVLFLEIPATGVFRIEIRDAVYRGRDDFVYRIRVSEEPFVTSCFPLGGREGARTVAAVEGWNLGGAELPLDTAPGPDRLRTAALERDGALSNPVAYEVGDLPEALEAEPNDAPESAQPLALPVVVNGRVSRPGDRDRFRFEGRAGDRIVAEVAARRLGSPLDSLLRLTDPSG